MQSKTSKFEEIAAKLSSDNAYRRKFFESPSAFFEKEILNTTLPDNVKNEIDNVYRDLQQQGESKGFGVPGPDDGTVRI